MYKYENNKKRVGNGQKWLKKWPKIIKRDQKCSNFALINAFGTAKLATNSARLLKIRLKMEK